MINTLIKFFLENRFITALLIMSLVAWGLASSPFEWNSWLPKNAVAVDAIPDIGENQQIIFTEWPGRSPQDIEDQISYPLTSSLLGIPGVKTIRSSSVFGFSSIYIIFDDEVEFYWSRSRILEKLNSLPQGLLPTAVQPRLGPDATALGQIFWYTLEGRDTQGQPIGGWDPQEIRSIQDYNVRFALSSVEGVSEVASIGGFVKEYQVEVNPNAMTGYGVTLNEIAQAVRQSNQDIGAKTLEINQAEYLVRGLGYIKSLEDLENAVIKTVDNTPVLLKDVAFINMGPASRRGALDKAGAEAVGGVVVARYGSNPVEVINQVKEKIEEIQTGLPKKILANGQTSQLTIVPFYDRTHLIKETIGTLEEALRLEVLITIIVVLVMLANLRASIMVSSLLPIAVLLCFVAMKYLGVDANIVALSGIAIAIGTMVDVGIVLTENITKKLEAGKQIKLFDQVLEGTKEVAPAVITAVLTTIVSFIPVFTLEAAEGKLFRPLAYTKTFALIAAIIVGLVILPSLAYWFFGWKVRKPWLKITIQVSLSLLGFICAFMSEWLAAFVLLGYSSFGLIEIFKPTITNRLKDIKIFIALIAITIFLAKEWLPLGVGASSFLNFVFVALIIGLTLGIFRVFIWIYPKLLNWCLENRVLFLIIPSFIILFGITIWQGFDQVFSFLPKSFGNQVRTNKLYSSLHHALPGIGKEFMPALNEGAFLLMPTSMPHSGIQQNRNTLRLLDMAVNSIPEVEQVVGKLGRVESALDPAPISMYENLINYKSEYITNENGRRIRFKYDQGEFVRDEKNQLIPDDRGQYFRQWRDHIKSPDDIWTEIVKVTNLPGVTSAPKLQPIETRLIMLQTGMRAPMGIKIKGPDLKTIESFGLELESLLKEIPSIKPEAVFAERIVGKPYLLIELDRASLARYGLSINEVQEQLQIAVGGSTLGTTVEGRERYNIRVRYPRELRDSPEALKEVLIPISNGKSVPVKELAAIKYEAGPQMIKSEDTFLIGYVIFDKQEGYSETQVVEDAALLLDELIAKEQLNVPAGVSFEFSGNFENQLRADKRLSIVIPIVLVIILIILYLQFKSLPISLMVFSGVAVAFGGGFMMLWLYGQSGFLDVSIFGTNLRDLLQISPINLSVAVWVGFIALFGIATDDGVLMATYLKQSFKETSNRSSLKLKIIEAGQRRVKPCLMTTATTLLALLPILTSTGRGSDIMIPMAIPVFGGMTVALITLFVVPVLYSYYQEFQLKKIEEGGEI